METENKVKARKIILSACVVALALIYAAQIVIINRSPVKTFKLKGEADKITISTSAKTLTLTFEEGKWLVGDKKREADSDAVQNLIDALREIKTHGTVSRSDDESELARYGLNDTQTIEVSVERAGKNLLSLAIGKDAAASFQNYVRISPSAEIFSASGDLRNVFSVDEETLRTHKIFPQLSQLSENEILSVAVTLPSETFVLEKSDSGEWTFSSVQQEDDSSVNSEKTLSLINRIKNLSAAKWAQENVSADFANENETRRITVATEKGKYTLECAPEYAEGEGSEKYLCSASTADDLFYISGYDYENLFKAGDDYIVSDQQDQLL